jgi:predicted membrane channel-forming protein YqfA (hemolysin III family)
VGRALVWMALGVVALIFVGWLVVSLFSTLLKLTFFLLVGAAVVGGVVYLVGRGRSALRGGKFKQLR